MTIVKLYGHYTDSVIIMQYVPLFLQPNVYECLCTVYHEGQTNCTNRVNIDLFCSISFFIP